MYSWSICFTSIIVQDEALLSDWKQKLERDVETMRAQSNIVNIRLVSLATSPDNFLFSSYSFIILCFFLLCFWMLSILWLFLDANDISSYCVALEYDITLVWFLKF